MARLREGIIPFRIPTSRTTLLWVYLLAAWALALNSCAPGTTPVPDETAGPYGIVDRLCHDQNLVGVVAAGTTADGLEWTHACGYADMEAGIPLETHHALRIASLSKSVTAVAFGILWENGLLDPDAPVQHYVPYFPVKAFKITSRQLAANTSGIRHYQGEEFGSLRRFDTTEEAIGVFAEDDLVSKPGERYVYSSYGWTLLAGVIESASGQPFTQFVQEKVFDRLALEHSFANPEGVPESSYIRYYEPGANGQPSEIPVVHDRNRAAAGGMLSNPLDLARFAVLVSNGSLLQDSTFIHLLRPQTTSGLHEERYGLGWGNQQHRGRMLFGHTGNGPGNSAVLILDPEHHRAVCLLSNTGGADLRSVGLRLFDEIFSNPANSSRLLGSE